MANPIFHSATERFCRVSALHKDSDTRCSGCRTESGPYLSVRLGNARIGYERTPPI